jgi:Ca-activated chloride channel homolog
MEKRPEGGEAEWVATFNSYSTDVDEDAAKLPAELAIDFPGRRQARTLVQGLLEVPREAVALAELGEHRSYNFVLNGEVLQDGRLFDNFRYKFDLPVTGAAAAGDGGEGGDGGGRGEGGDGESAAATARAEGPIPLVFERYLRPGDYRLILKLEDINGKAFYREERALSVPQVERNAPPPPEDAFSRRLLAEANAALSTGETTVRIVEPMSEILTGFHRFETLTTGPGIAKVEFSLDNRSVLVKRRPPFSVELDLGQVPRARTLVVTAFDEAGAELARDEMLINAGGSRFSVDLVEPRKGETYTDSLRAEVQVEVPEGKVVERVELFLNETRLATLYQEPWTQTIVLPDDEYLAYVRAVAYLPDGNSTEDLVFVNAPDYLDEVDVQFVELYAAVLDRDNRPVSGLTQADFTPVEDGVTQQIARFEVVDNLPIHAGILLDVSASMDESLEESQAAALQFLEQAIEPKDRATLVTFNDRPNLKVKFTNDVTELAGGLAGLKAERGTALYDSLIFSLYYFNGVRGQKALLVLSDGKDESSRYTHEDALEYARRAGVTVYSIALRDDQAHKKLSKIAEETGGRSFFLQDPSQLPGVYEAIQRELRSRYLVAYQSSNATDSQDFRTVELKVSRPGAEAKTLRGYYP